MMAEHYQKTLILTAILLPAIFVCAPALAATTQVQVIRYANDEMTIINETTVDYTWMEANLPVYGNGNTYYYFQGPIFEGEWEANYGVSYPEYRTDWPGGIAPAWTASEERWDRYWNGSGYDQMEETNWQTKNLGKLKGTNVKDLCDLVGGVPVGQKVRVLASDNVYMDLPYSAVYSPSPELGPYVITWWSVGAGESGATSGYTGPDYTTGMRATFFSNDSRNPSGEHVAGLGDQAEGLPPEYWYYYGDGYPSMGGWTLKYVDRVCVYSNDPVPLPVADFSANIKTGRVLNGNFETGGLAPWTGSGAMVSSSYAQKKDTYSVGLVAGASDSAWIQQDIDLTTVGSISFWRHYFGGAGKYMEVLVDDTVVANYSETTTIPNDYEIIDITSSGFSGNRTLKFNVVNTNPSGSFTVYLDNIEDYRPGTSGEVPLTIQFDDLSTKMEDASHTSWAWDFENDGTVDSTQQNPIHTYGTAGTYTVKLTVTNAAGSDDEEKADYITVNPATIAPVAAFTSDVTSGTAPLTVQFTDQSTNDPTSWAWDFENDGTVDSTQQNPSHIYAIAGNHTVNLTVSNAAGSHSEVKIDHITVTAPPPNEQELYLSPSSAVVALGTTVDYAIQVSSFPEGLSGYDLHVSLDVPSVAEIVSVNYPGWAMLNNTTPQPPGDLLRLSAVDIGMLVEPGSGTTLLATITVRGDNTGTGTITLSNVNMDADGGALITPSEILPAEIIVYIPIVADFEANITSGRVSPLTPLFVAFTDRSTGVPPGSQWSWDFNNDGVVDSTAQNPITSYTVPGNYTVNLTVQNAYSADTEIKLDYIMVNSHVRPFPGQINNPTDPDNDLLYEDINGNSRLDYDDVVLYYENMQWIRDQDEVGIEPFDYNHNGRIDYDDVVLLYWKVLASHP